MLTRTVTLELLRHGPSHNQLLSPLTPYLALCGNYEAETVHVGFEHVQFMRRMRGLRYADGRPAEGAAMGDAAFEVSRIIAGIQSLTAEISSAPRGDKRLIHLRLILSASELALLPFELIDAPPGFPGAGQPLSLQTAAPIALTREVRRVSATTIRWPDRPRILVVAASPPGVPAVPLRAHLLALRWALDPWLFTGTEEELGRHVTVLPRATLTAVREACAAVPFTHVHVLAHGVETDATGDRYGLAFHADGDADRMDVVTGSRLAAALRCHPSGPSGADLSSPAVVTVASCDSGNVGSVVAPGASVAHQLHEAGIPLVLASQFPLSVRGSAIMAETVYTRLLRGEDPRVLVHDLRQVLHVSCPDTHDWASVVAYASLPADIDKQVQDAKFRRAVDALEAAIGRHDYAERAGKALDDRGVEAMSQAMKWLRSAVPEDEGLALGVLANAKKRVAHTLFAGAPWPLLEQRQAGLSGNEELELEDGANPPALPAEAAPPADDARAAHRGVAPPRPGGDAVARPAAESTGEAARAQRRARGVLEEARRHYLDIFRRGSGEAWPIVQFLVLTAVLDPPDQEPSPRTREAKLRDYTNWWTTAFVLAEDNLRVTDPQRIIWAHGSLVELYVLAKLLPHDHWARRVADEKAETHLDYLLAMAKEFDAYSVRRQLLRMSAWWWKDRADLRELPTALGEKLARKGIGTTLLHRV
jgi:hypothetical protein